jgi:hypothetical protein
VTSWAEQQAQLEAVLAGNFIGALLHEPVHWVLDELNQVGDTDEAVNALSGSLRYVVPSIAWVSEEQIGAGVGAPTLSVGELWFEWHWPLRTGQEELAQNAGFISEVLSRRSFAGFQFFDVERREQGRGQSHYILRQCAPFEHCDVWAARPFASPAGNAGGALATGSRTFLQAGHGLAVGQPVRPAGTNPQTWIQATAAAAATLAQAVVTRVMGDYFTVTTGGFVLAEAHGRGAAGTRHWTSTATPGATVTAAPGSGFSQYLYEVFDENNLVVAVATPEEVAH